MSEAQRFQILSLKDPVASPGRDVLFFTVETTGDDIEFACPADHLGSIMQFFAVCATAVGNGEGGAPPTNDIFPIPTLGIGLQEGSSPDTKMLILNVAGHALAFEMPNTKLAELGRAATTLSAGGRPN
jgi:hypothetical protein